MSRFFSDKYKKLTPYTPGEQPQDMKYIKLNTNESPFPPSKKAIRAAYAEAKRLQLYSDPECAALTKKLAALYGVAEDEIIFTNGSDDILNFAFMAFCDDKTGAAFCDITYGFYPVFATVNNIKYEEIPLREDYTVDKEKFLGIGKTIFIANPNAPTGIALPLSDIEEIVAKNPDNVVLIDEAYVDFGAESAVTLIPKYKNLLVTQTFSKSRSMAGGRLGFAIGNRELIRDLNTLRFSTNPYNINRMTMAAGIGVIEDEDYTRRNCKKIEENREYTVSELTKLGFTVLPSKANFVFAAPPSKDGGELYRELKRRGILVRYFDKPRLSEFVRITIGSRRQMEALIKTLKEMKI